jgi:hypothetical protein
MGAKKVLLVTVCVIALVTGCTLYKSDISDTVGSNVPPENDAVEHSSAPYNPGPEVQNGDLDSSAEEQVHQLFEASGIEEQDYFDAILDVLPGIDWSVYSKQYGVVGDNTTGAMELLEWLTHNPRTMQADNMLKIFQARRGLDGALTEQYSIIVGSFFRSDEERFVQLLSRIDEQGIEQVCRFVAYNCYYIVDMEQVRDSTIARYEDKQLPDKERFVVDALITAFSSFITDDSP